MLVKEIVIRRRRAESEEDGRRIEEGRTKNETGDEESTEEKRIHR